jgi:hypothetical protein
MRKLLIATIALAGLALASHASAETCVGGSFAPDDPGECTSTAPSLISGSGTVVTWCSGALSGPMILNEEVFVTDNATLIIPPGCVIRGQPRQVAPGQVQGVPGALIITQSGYIDAQGTLSNPIIFTTAAIDNNSDGVPDDLDANAGFADPYGGAASGDALWDDTPLNAPRPPLDASGAEAVQLWGGVVIMGQAPTNQADWNAVGHGSGLVEGVQVPGFPVPQSRYGGVNPHDSSGKFRYVSIHHAGDELGEANELNCLTLAGVGDGTQIDHIDCYLNFDDGFEWFGGTVDTQFLVGTYIGDDTFDMDQGFTGIGEFWFGIMPTFNEDNADNYGSKSGDKCAEWDGDDYFRDPGTNNHNLSTRYQQPGTGLPGAIEGTPWPLSFPTVYNLTCIGSTPGVADGQTPPAGGNPAVSAAGANRGINMRNGFAGLLLNSMMINTGTAAGLSVQDGDGSITGFETCTNNVLAGPASGGDVQEILVAIGATTFDDVPVISGGSCEDQALVNGDALVDYWGFTNSQFDNCVNPASGFFAFNGLQQEWTAIDPKGGADGKLDVSDNPAGAIDPRPEATTATCIAGITPQHSETSRLDGVAMGGMPPNVSDPTAVTMQGAAAFRGAFKGASPLWTNGWAVLNRAGLLVSN